MFFLVRFIMEWFIWLILADKKRWRELFPVAFLASLLGSVTDNIMHQYLLWDYAKGKSVFPELANDFGTYVVVTYLFIQWLPKKKTFWIMFGYWFVWTGITISIEWLHLITKNIEHYRGWNLGFSYVADWILFWIFYQYHKVFKLEKLSG